MADGCYVMLSIRRSGMPKREDPLKDSRAYQEILEKKVDGKKNRRNCSGKSKIIEKK